LFFSLLVEGERKDDLYIKVVGEKEIKRYIQCREEGELER
jgi:hypothetical protein